MTMFSTWQTRMNDGVPAEIDSAKMVEAETTTIINEHTTARDGKKGIGPSEIGDPCSITLVHKINGDVVARGFQERWLMQQGTFGHAGLQDIFSTCALNQADPPRFLLEKSVMVGQAMGQDIWGSCDLFDTQTGTVLDWKFTGPTRLLHYQSKGPGQQYRVQAHLYGRGLQLLGYPVQTVMIAFLPRNGELGNGLLRAGGTEWVNRGKRYFWSEPYDESVALAALARLNGLHELMQIVGPAQLLSQLKPCDNYWCNWCSTRRSR